MGGEAQAQPAASSGGGLLDELSGVSATPAGAFGQQKKVMGSAAGVPLHQASAAQGTADMFGGLSLGGEMSYMCLTNVAQKRGIAACL